MKKYKKFIFIGVLVVFNLYIVFFTNYKCPWRRDFNIYCAGCGGTSMLRSLMKLDFYQAFRYNPLVFILFVGVILLKILRFNFSKKSKKYVSYFLLVIVIFYGVLRNIELFSYLQPTIIH